MRDGKHTSCPSKPHGPRLPLRYDSDRAKGLRDHAIGVQRRKERPTPLRGGI